MDTDDDNQDTPPPDLARLNREGQARAWLGETLDRAEHPVGDGLTNRHFMDSPQARRVKRSRLKPRNLPTWDE